MCRLNGQTLAEIATSKQHLAQLADWVAPSPGEALRRLANKFGAAPTPSGSNMEGILQLREALFDACSDIPELLHSFLIVAPHTHWDSQKPVILSKYESAYRIGPMATKHGEEYSPISFVFTPEGLCAYEWADSSIRFESEELRWTMSILEVMHEKFVEERWPLGVSLNCRFKGLLDPPVEGTLEYSNDDLDADSSTVYLLSDFEDQSEQRDYVHVGWHPYSDRCYGLPPLLTTHLKRIRKMSEDLSDTARAELRELLKEY